MYIIHHITMIYLCIIISKTNNYNIHLSSNGRVRCTYIIDYMLYNILLYEVEYIIGKSRVFNIKFTSESCECACVWYIRRTEHRTDPKV